jgi:subtilase family serine protease
MKNKNISLISLFFLLSAISALAALDLKFNNTISMSPALPSAGTTVTFSVMFMPSGAAVDNLECAWGIDGTTIGQKTFGHLNANATSGLSFNWTATAGYHIVFFKLDPSFVLSDSNHANNTIQKSFIVGSGGTGQPDLKPKISYIPTNFKSGQAISISYTVENIGTADSMPCLMELKKGTTHVYTFNVPVVIAGGHWSTVHPWAVECNADLNVTFYSNNANAETN